MSRIKKFPPLRFIIGLSPISFWEVTFFVFPMCLVFLVSFLVVHDLKLLIQFTLENYANIFSKMVYLKAYVRSLGLSLITVLISSCLAYPLAYTIAFEVPYKYRRLLLVAMILPFWTNYLIRAYAWQIILANNGLLNQILKILNVIDTPITILYTHVATVIGFTHFYIVLLTMLLYSSMESIDSLLLEAAGDLGAGRFQSFIEIIFPLSRPGLIVGGVFVFIMSFGDFVAPSILGGGRKPVFTQMIVDEIQGTVNWSMASALAIVMVITILIILGIFLRKAESNKNVRLIG